MHGAHSKASLRKQNVNVLMIVPCGQASEKGFYKWFFHFFVAIFTEDHNTYDE